MKEKYRLFVEECQELLAELESALLELESNPQSEDGVHRVFRALHTIKGAAGMLGLEDVRELTNDFETVFDLVRAGSMPCTEPLISLSFTYEDLLTKYLADPESGLPMDETTAILARLEELVDKPKPAGDVSEELPGDVAHAKSVQTASQEPETPRETRYFALCYSPAGKRFDAFDPMDLFSQLAELGDCTTGVARKTLPPLEEVDPDVCSLSWDVVLRTQADEDSVQDTFMFMDNPEDISGFRSMSQAEAEAMLQDMADAAQVRNELPESAATSGKVRDPRPSDTPRRQASPVDQGDQDSQDGTLSAEPFAPPTAQAAPADIKREDIASIRVSAPKLDDMIDLVGQLVIVQARLKQIETELHHPHLTSVSEEIERLSNDLRERTLSLRMLPIGSTFNKFRRLVRDLSVDLGKEIELKTFGAETELDKTVIERMGDPLVHIMRNSIDHGIESGDVRQANGKPRRGTITLSAKQSAGQVHIIIEDDGGGIDPDKIFTKAVERGLVRADNRPSNKDILQYIFHPGFSTAEKVTAVSGRGVGMDVVRRSLEALKGSVEVDSQAGRGTTITIGLPLTLAIIEGLLVLVGEEYYVVPLSEVIECLEVTRKKQELHRLTLTIDVRGKLLPSLVARNWFHLTSPAPDIEQVVVVQAGTRRIGIVVDMIVGQLQTVIKGLGRVFTGMKGISGATIMGNGSLALILDIPSLMHELERHEKIDE